VAVCDLDESRAESLASEFGAESYAELDRMLQRPDVDVVSVCLPSGLHAAAGVRAAEAGKHVLVEKPIDVTLEAADRLIAAARANGVVGAVVSQHRFDAGVRRLREALEAGRLGRLLLGDAVVKWYRTQQYYRSADWRGTLRLDGGGALINQAIHYVDLLLWTMGPVERVFARTVRAAHDIEVEDIALAVLTFRNGALGTIQASTSVYPGLPERLEISGSGGTVIVEAGQVAVWELEDEKGDTGPYGASSPVAREPAQAAAADPAALSYESHRLQIADMLEAVESGRDPLVTLDEGRRTLETVLAVYESARQGREVTLPGPDRGGGSRTPLS
jgi:UDP-N-acetyl-2-amino-2-deoxyglucuronate dehydrogenase